MTNASARIWLEEERIVFDCPDYDEAIIGVTHDGRVAYDFDRMVDGLVKNNKMSRDEAIEFIEFNAIRAIPYVEDGPVVIYRIEEE